MTTRIQSNARPTVAGAAFSRIGGQAGFTMVEIALSIAIVAFAMVAILGVMPVGLEVQKENRDDTIINQDGTYLLEAIRSGSIRLDELTNFVERIALTNSQANNQGSFVIARRVPQRTQEIPLTNANFIIGMLSTPTLELTGIQGSGPQSIPRYRTNEVTAYMRSISGTAGQRFEDVGFRENAFSYLVTTKITPYVPFPTNITVDVNDPVLTNRHLFARTMETNLYDLQLKFRWPVTEMSNDRLIVGKSEKTFRTLVSGLLLTTNNYRGVNLWQFHPGVHPLPNR